MLKIGTELPNGAIVIAEQDGVILANNNCGTRDEYVTWRWNGVDPRTTYWGHYFNGIGEAAQDFEKRVRDRAWRAA